MFVRFDPMSSQEPNAPFQYYEQMVKVQLPTDARNIIKNGEPPEERRKQITDLASELRSMIRSEALLSNTEKSIFLNRVKSRKSRWLIRGRLGGAQRFDADMSLSVEQLKNNVEAAQRAELAAVHGNAALQPIDIIKAERRIRSKHRMCYQRVLRVIL
jgi:hypothetical protein